jgi:hypothetical protein
MNSWADEKRRTSRPTDLRRVLKRSAHGWIVVDDEDYCALAHACPSFATGSENRKIAP